MKKTIIGFYSVYLSCYDSDPIFMNLDESDIKEQYRRAILNDPDGAFKAHMNEKRLMILGQFDDETGSFVCLAQPKAVMELASCFPAGYLAKKEQEKQVSSQVMDSMLGGVNHA